MGMIMAAVTAAATGILFLAIVDVKLKRDAAVGAIHLAVADDILRKADRLIAVSGR